MVAVNAVRQGKAAPAEPGAGRKEAGVAASAVPPMRLPHATRAAVRAVLLAELLSAGTRARAAGCPPDVLFDVLDVRLRSAVEESRDGRHVVDARLRSAVEDGQDGRRDPVEPGLVGESGG